MKIRKAIIGVLLGAFISLTAVCLIFGPKIRDILSPEVDYICPEYMTVDQNVFITLPTEVIICDESGAEYVLVAELSEKYPERCYEVHKKEVRTSGTYGEKTAVSYGVQIGDKIINPAASKDIEIGQRVILNNQ